MSIISVISSCVFIGASLLGSFLPCCYSSKPYNSSLPSSLVGYSFDEFIKKTAGG